MRVVLTTRGRQYVVCYAVELYTAIVRRGRQQSLLYVYLISCWSTTAIYDTLIKTPPAVRYDLNPLIYWFYLNYIDDFMAGNNTAIARC